MPIIVFKMIRNGEKVANVILLETGKCIVEWPTSVIVYDSLDAAMDVHIDHMNGRGEKTTFDFVWASHEHVSRAIADCWQDRCENTPFSSVGGFKNRDNMQVPNWIVDGKEEYLLGYKIAARMIINWETGKS